MNFPTKHLGTEVEKVELSGAKNSGILANCSHEDFFCLVKIPTKGTAPPKKM